MNVEFWTEAAQFLFWEHINGIFVAVCVFLICRLFLQDMRALKPTILPAVPRFINRIYARY
jgi:hypothetical protein